MNSTEQYRRLLKGHYLFRKLGDGEVDELIAHARVEHYPAGREVFAKGSPGQSLMAVLAGSVKMTAPSSDGREIVFNIMGAGEVFGEIALLDGRDRTAGATAITDSDLLVLYRRDFLPFLQRRADVCIMLLEILCQRLRQTSEQVEDVSFVTLETRVAKLLLRLAHTDAQADGEGGGSQSRVLRITQRELGNMVGSARESVNRQLQTWQRAGLIELGKGSVAIRDFEALRRMV